MSRKSVFACALPILVILFIGSYSSLAQTNASQAGTSIDPLEDVESYIDPAIQGEEREVMRDIIRKLPVNQRDNVTYVGEQGRVYGNKPSMKQVDTANSLGNGAYTYDGIEVFGKTTEMPLPDFDTGLLSSNTNSIAGRSSKYCIIKNPVSNFQFTGTGPYRRVTSYAGYSASYAYVTLPHEISIRTIGSDTPYIYTGFSGTSELDAGFQYSPAKKNWALFTNVPPIGQVGLPRRYRYGQSVDMTFETLPRTTGNPQQIAISATGLDSVENTVPRIVTQTLVSIAPLARRDGVGLSIKRMTSIAQVGGDNFRSGSYLKGVWWRTCRIGQNTGNFIPWFDLPLSRRNTRGGQNWPNRRPPIIVTLVDASEETDSIVLE
jgi:hypothetical protein